MIRRSIVVRVVAPLAMIAAGAVVCACASVLGIDAPIDDLRQDASGSPQDASGSESATPDARSADAAEAGDAFAPDVVIADGLVMDVVTVDAATADAPVGDAGDGGCPLVVPDDGTGIFVEPTNGTDSSTCGARTPATAPCKSIQKGLDRAHVMGLPYVYVAAGTYTEQLSLYAGMTLQGGWEVLGTGWSRACVDAKGAVTVTAPSTANATILAAALHGSATLSTLTVRSKAAAAPGESLYGVVATDATTTLTLDEVDVQVGPGGDGSAGTLGTTPPDATGDCLPAGDGGAGAMVAEAGVAADAGSFASAGYLPIAGSAGGSGASGQNGVQADAGMGIACVTCKQGLLSCNTSSAGTECGQPGGMGCAGAAGGGGGGGAGGGSSIPVYAWDATVNVGATCKLDAGKGGNGGPGGAAGGGGNGSVGSTGAASPSCGTSCGSGCNPVPGTASGSAGSRGGAGSAGASGGGGAGGWSCGYVQGGAAVVTVVDPSGISISAPGAGGGSGATGKASPVCP